MTSEVHHDSGEGTDVPRRSFVIRFLAGLVGSMSIAIPGVSALGFLLGPLRRGASAPADRGASGFLPVGWTREALPEDGTPVSVTVRADRVDAWNFYPQIPIGKIWLRRIGDQIIAFHRTCPHLGCDIDYRAPQQDFFCPCHASQFSLAGQRQNSIPPRDMDTLETRLVEGRIEVRFQDFRGALPEKVPV